MTAAGAPTTPAAPVHVVVADDEPHVGRIVQLKLEQGPFRVSLAADGHEAIALLARHDDVALLVLDLMMPGLSGLDVLAQLQDHPRWRRLPRLVLTAAGDTAARTRAIALGATEIVSKPFSPKRLLERVHALTGVPGPAEAGA